MKDHASDLGSPEIWPQQSTLSTGLAWAIFLFGLFSACYTVKLVFKTYCPVPFWDHWEVVGTFMRAGGHLRLRDLWAQHNEHRIPLGRLLCFADFSYFGGRNISLLCEIYAIQVAALLLLVWVMRRMALLTGPLFITTLGFCCYCCLSPLAAQNFTWPFQTTFVLCGLGATAAFALAVLYGQQPLDGARRNLLLAACLLSGFISEASLASGLAVWPVLLALAFWLEFKPFPKLVLGISSAAAIAAYMIGYRTPEKHSNPLSTILHPLKILKYMLTEMAAGWDAHLPNASAWPTFAESVSFLAIAGVFVFTYRFVRGSSKSPLDAFLLANLWFLLLAMFMTALGRMRFGYEQATAGRYSSVSLFFWACIAIKLASLLAASDHVRTLLPVTQTFLLILLMSVASRYATMDSFAKDRGTYLRRGLSALEHGGLTDPAPLFTDRNLVLQGYAFLRRSHWIPVPQHLISARLVQSVPQGTVEGYKSAVAGECEGYVGVVEEGESTLSLSGWAWDPKQVAAADEIVLVSPSGSIVGKGKVGVDRPDVSAVRPLARLLKTGWTGDFTLSAPGEYSVFALFKQYKVSCPLRGQIIVSFQPVPPFPELVP
jgi:hypothetical protein